jgi:hypothetical protein
MVELVNLVVVSDGLATWIRRSITTLLHLGLLAVQAGAAVLPVGVPVICHLEAQICHS